MEKIKNKILVIIIIFLVIAVTLTFFSSTINQLGIARVEVYDVIKGKLQWDIRTEGRIVGKDEVNIYPAEALKVKAIHVKEGDTVEAGQILIEFDTASFEDELAAEEMQFQTYALEIEKIDLKLSETVDIDDSQQEKKEIEDDRSNKLKQLDETYQLKETLALHEVEMAEKDYDNNKIIYDAGGETLKNLNIAEETVTVARFDYQQVLTEKQSEQNAINNEADSKQTSLAKEVKAGQSANRLKQQTKDEMQIQRKSLELAQQDSQSKINRCKEKINSCSTLSAFKALFVQEVKIEEGAIAVLGSPLIKAVNQAAGLQVKFQLTDKELENVFLQDKAHIKTNIKGNQSSEVVIQKISVKEADDSKNGAKEVWAEGKLTDFQLGDKVSVEITKESQPYENIVPTKAIRGSGIDAFVFVVRQRNNSLGEESYLQKVKARIGDSDGSTTAVISGLTWSDRVIVESSKPLFEGDKVRIVNKIDKMDEDGSKNEN